jgi:hypothetical protein
LTQQELEILLQVVCGYITQSENIWKYENAIIQGSNLASFVEKFGNEEMVDLDKVKFVTIETIQIDNTIWYRIIIWKPRKRVFLF